VTTVVTTATSIGRRLAGDKRASVEGVDLRGNEALIDAAERAGVERFVFVSVPMDSEMLVAPLPRAKQRLEWSPMREVILRPEMFQEIWLSEIVQLDWRNGKATIFGRGETPHAYVAVDDVAETCVRTALAERATGRPIRSGASRASSCAPAVRRSAVSPRCRRP
jgi:uncharacterized protein YbjT (DUF2867 family)